MRRLIVLEMMTLDDYFEGPKPWDTITTAILCSNGMTSRSG